MTINRTTLLDLPLPVTGTESGTWGNITNNGLSQYVDIAVAGMNALTSSDFTAGALTISNTLGTSAATNIAAGSAQYATIKVSSLAQNSTITAPASNRSYRIINADSTYNLTIKASGQTGITFLPGQTGVVAFTGTDYEVVGVVNAASSTDNAVPKFDGTTGQIIQNTGVTIDDSNNVSGVAQLNATTADLTNIEVTNIKAKDGTASATIADSTGVMTIATLVGTNDATVNGLTVGRGAGAVSTNTAVGASALAANTSGADNVAIGRSAASGATTASFGTYVGSLSGNSGITGNNNTALGYYAYGSGSSGANNTALGVQALYLNTTGSNNTALGYQAGYTSTTNGYITAIGDSALYANTQAFNTAVGGLAATANDTGYIAAFGSATLQNNTTGTGNAGFGSYDNAVATLRNNSTGSYNSAFGFGALQANTTASNNTAVGYQAVYTNTVATNITAMGYQAAYLSGTANTVAVGYQAHYQNLTGNNSVAIGYQALYGGASADADGCVAVGHESLLSVTTGDFNVGLGMGTLRSTNSGANNTAVGYHALYLNETGARNTAVGYAALDANTTGTDNVAVGFQAATEVTTGTGNTVVGREAGEALTTSSNCTFLGSYAGEATTGANNTFIGGDSGYTVTTGASNTFIGRYSGNQGGLDLRGASNYTVLSDGDGNWRAYNGGAGWYQSNNSSSWSTASDQRLKDNIINIENGLNTILQLRPVEFDYKVFDKQHDAGFIAQEYKNVLAWQVSETKEIGGEVAELTDGEPALSIQQNLVPYLVKAIQELSAQVTALQAEVNTLKGN
jgi:trimeric autotransporter adhesin